MKVAISGATGFLGTPLLQALADAGHSLRVLGRKAPSDASGSLDFARFDAGVPDGLVQGALDGCDAVIHLAGESIAKRWSRDQKTRVLQSRQNGTLAIARAAVASKVPTVISASAIGFYGERGDEKLTEQSSAGEGFLSEVCQAWEAALEPARQGGVRTVSVRIGVVLHPSGGALQRMALPIKMGVGGKLGSGRQWVSWIHRTDLVNLFVHLLASTKAPGAYNGTAPEPATNADLTHELGRALHRPTFFPVPKLALNLALGEMSEMVLSSARVLPERTLQSGFQFQFPRLSEALEDLYAPTAHHREAVAAGR
jgi:uncharacterized protein